MSGGRGDSDREKRGRRSPWGRAWLRRGSLRVRYTLTVIVLAATAFIIGGAVALNLYHDSLVSSVDHDVLAAAESVAAGAQRATLPNPIPMPVAAGVPSVQVLDANNKVISGDPVSALTPPMFNPTQAGADSVVSVTDPAGLPQHRAAIAVVHIHGPSGAAFTVLAELSLDPADAEASRAVQLSAMLGAISVVVIGAVAWAVVGRTLRRVELLRAQVETITSSGDLGQRLEATGTDELSRLGSTLNDMLATLAESNERQRRFVADAAHELRTPLAGLSASLQVAISHPETTRDNAWLNELADGHRRLGRLVNDLLVLAALDGKAPQQRRDVDLAGVITDATRRSTPPGIHLRVDAVEHAIVSGDEAQISRIVTNLVDNALRYATSSVTVTLTIRAQEAIVSVTDDGPGIPAADRERIWNRFVRLDQGRSRTTGGSGLGLALVKELTESHHGTVAVTSGKNEAGTSFTVSLPLRPVTT